MTSFEENHAFSQDESAQAAIENAAPEAYVEAAQASVTAPPADAADAPVPGAAFAALGLAPELVAAVTDLG